MAEQNWDDIEAQLKDAAAKNGVTYDQSDLEDVKHRDGDMSAELKKYDYRSDNTPNSDQDNNDGRSNPWEGGGSAAPAAGRSAGSTGSGGSSGGSNILQNISNELMGRQQQDAGRRDALYNQLNTQATQSLAMDGSDPIIAGQTDAYRAEQERSKRNYLSDLAERSGPDANLRGEQRMAAEKTGQAVGGFQAQLLGRELSARRQQIAEALNSERQILTADQQASLQQQLALLDNEIKNRGLDIQDKSVNQDWQKALLANEMAQNNLGFNYWDRSNFYDNQNLG